MSEPTAEPTASTEIVETSAQGRPSEIRESSRQAAMTLEDLFEAITTLKGATEFASNRSEARFNRIEMRFDGLEGRFDRLEMKFDRLETRVEALEDGQRAIRSDIAGLTRKLR